ncbi:sugar ABC transporter substrate-binding protein [Curtobacterium sp. MCBD17_035]|uniref:ABC transporter substrate-binding protein n=1 Tax=Curtobacterium sp. MCBD17_035 TaxID=2175673 RepID=UPI000DA9E3B7|nr:sugar ABC transporter substrate-binding protein [Curtobacterium sp. MCBD17_035]WIB67342.1 sugar ABC transporter substrate-binding protein [Curtobacterium sp. MCBD17_035]
MDRRTFLAGSVLGGAAFALAGCSGSLPAISSSDAGFGGKATGTVQVWCRAATQAGLTATVADFNRDHPDLHVDLTPVPDAQYVTKLATAIRGGEPPDVVDVDDINSMLFIFRDAFADLTSAVKGLDYFDQLSTGHLHLLERGGRYYGLPYLADNSMLYLNTELFDRAGLDPTESTKDFDGLLDAAKKIRALGDDVYGWSIAGNSPGILGFVVQPHIWATGTDMMLGAVGKQHGHITGNDGLEQTLEFYRQLWKDGLMSRNAFSDAGTTWGADFRAGTVGIMPTNYGSTWNASTKSMQKKMATALIPGPTGGRAFFDGGDNMCIPNGAPNPNGGWAFMQYANSLKPQQNLPTGGYFPTRGDAATAEYRRKFPLASRPLDNLDKGYAPQTLAYNLLVNQPSAPFFTMFRTAVFGAGVQQALRAAAPEYDRILDQAQA